jgi:prepilin-type N-terminal cleavage/methylation domain-containing protein
MKHTRRFYSGYSLIEIMIALALFSMISSGVLALLFSDRFVRFAGEQSIGVSQYAEEGAEAVRMMREQRWSNLADGTFGLVKSGSDWILQGTSDTRNGMTRQIIITSRDANSKIIKSQVTYTAFGGRTATVSVPVMLTDWRDAIPGDTSSDPTPTGDWTHPISGATADISPSGSAGTDLIVDSNTLYLTSNHPSVDKPDLHIFNISDPYHPTFLTSLDLGMRNAYQLTKRGNYVYVINNDTSNQLTIVDVSNPLSPTKVTTINIDTSHKPKSIVATGTAILIGTENNPTGPELYAISTDPFNPQIVGTMEVGGDVNQLDASGNAVAAATSVDSAELMVISIANLQAMAPFFTYNAPGSEDGTAVFFKDLQNLFLGRTLSATQEFVMLDSTGTVKGTFEVGAPVIDMYATAQLAFIVTDDSAQFRILNITNPAAIVRQEASGAALSFPQNMAAITFSNNYVYMAVRSNAALRMITSTQ